MSERHLLLAGGGHAHVHVLRALGQAPWRGGVRVTLVTPHPRQLYSGMVPGLVAGHYDVDRCVIPLVPLARAAGVAFVQDAVSGVDAAQRRVRLAGGGSLAYDALSLDTGPVMDRDALPGAREHGLFVRPIETFVQRFDSWRARAAAGPLRTVVVGGGAAGVELAMALAHRQRAGVGTGGVALIAGDDAPLSGFPDGVRRRAVRALARQGIEVHAGTAAEVASDHLQLSDGRRLACDAALIAIGASAPPWLAGSGLALDARGFVATSPTLQSLSHPEVFAAGDVASRPDQPHPKSGVHAVRAGPPLAANLRAWAAGAPLAAYTPPTRTLYLLSLGARRAIASWGPFAAEGDWVWRWKDHIDRAFIARYAMS